MQAKIIRVDVEVKKPGARGWSLATVMYNTVGSIKTEYQNVASFSNPAVFKAVQEAIGETVEVEVGQNDKGYPDWKAVRIITGTAGSPAATTGAAPAGNTGANATRVTGSNYETPAERARRQVLIVRQSSLSNAIDILKSTETEIEPDSAIILAQKLVDWVFETPEFIEE